MKLKWSIHQLYFYLVCFVTLIVIIYGLTNIIRAGIQVLVPIPEDKPAHNYSYEKSAAVAGDYQETSTLPKDVIEAETAKGKSFYEEQQRRQSLYDPLLLLLQGLFQILTAFPVYLYHWRKIPKLG